MKLARYLVVASALSTAGGMALAGGLDEPLIEPVIIEEATVASGHDILVPIMALILLGAAAAAAD